VQVLTGESWAEVVARPLIFGFYKDHAIGPSLYFVFFIVLMQIVLVNVVVAVLLDKFVESPEKEDDSDEQEGGADDGVRAANSGSGASAAPAGASGARRPSGSAGGAPGAAQFEALRAEVAEMREQLKGISETREYVERMSLMLEALVNAKAGPAAGVAPSSAPSIKEGLKA
jgi:hypothetical protein